MPDTTSAWRGRQTRTGERRTLSGWAAVTLAPALLLGACALGPDGTPCYITSDLRCLEMEYQRGNDGADPNWIDPNGAWEATLDGEYMVFNLSALGQEMTDGTRDYYLDGNNVWRSYDGGTIIQFDTPERGYIWFVGYGSEGTLFRLTWG